MPNLNDRLTEAINQEKIYFDLKVKMHFGYNEYEVAHFVCNVAHESINPVDNQYERRISRHWVKHAMEVSVVESIKGDFFSMAHVRKLKVMEIKRLTKEQ